VRELLSGNKEYIVTKGFDRKTLVTLLYELLKYYPDIRRYPSEKEAQAGISLADWLGDAKSVRNSVAHGDFLSYISIKNLFEGHESDGIDRLTMKSIYKNVCCMDEALFMLLEYRDKKSS
jgi:hypothetical protein